MAFPQLPGQASPASGPNNGSAVIVSVLALAGILGIVGWRFVPHSTSVVQAPSAVAVPSVPPAPQPPSATQTSDQHLHLAHAEQELIAAAEQLKAARLQLSALSPDLNRSYLQFEKRRADRAWTACDNAQRAIEEAREHIKVIVSTGKDN